MTIRLAFLLAIAFMMCQPSLSSAQSDISFVPVARIDESSLSGVIAKPIIWSFDLSPDGKSVALMAAAGSEAKVPLWLLIEDIATKRVTVSREVGAAGFPMGDFAPQVRYSSDQRYLVFQDLQTIRVFDSKSLELTKAIPAPSSKLDQKPLFILGASNANVLVCAFGREQQLNPGFHTTPVQVTIVDISTGERLGEWASEDVPQSISPKGDLIAVSSLHVHRGVLPLKVLDIHAQQIAELTGGLSFRQPFGQSKPLGRVLGFFVGSQELLLTPDENIDQTGHQSGDSLQLVDVAGKQAHVRQRITPKSYGPTGELAVSADYNSAVVISWYEPARALAQKWALPASSPEALVLRRGATFQIEAALPIKGFGLTTSGWLENRRPRISSDGSVVAIAQDGGVSVLTKSPLPNRHP